MLLLVEVKEAWEESNRKRKIRLRPQAAAVASAGDSSVLLNFIYKPLLVCERVAQQAETQQSVLKVCAQLSAWLCQCVSHSKCIT